MPGIAIDHLSFGYPGQDLLFDDLTLNIDGSWKLGLVGRNGRGKTTLLSLIDGENGYSGRIESSLLFSRFPWRHQNPDKTGLELVEEQIPDLEVWRLEMELSLLGCGLDTLYRPFGELSGGEKTRIMLGALFAGDADFALIDEPTDHLDQDGRKAVADYLAGKTGFILVSHDRTLLDACTDHILAIMPTGTELVAGNWSLWRKGFEERMAFEKEKDGRLRKEIGRLKSSASRTANWSDQVEKSKIGAADKGFVGHKAAKMMKRSKSAQKRMNQAIEDKRSLLQDFEENESLKIPVLPFRQKQLAVLEDVQTGYSGIMVHEPVSFLLCEHDRLFLIGHNGCGKSTLIKALAGLDIEKTGKLETASGLVISYVSQSTDHLTGSLKQFAQDQDIDLTLFLAILRKMGFGRDLFERPMDMYSLGQKKKVLIAASLSTPAHLYLWDEALNALDIESREQIEQLIQAADPSMILIEHDAAFQKSVGTRFIEIKATDRTKKDIL